MKRQRPTRAREFVNWSAILDSIPTEGMIEIPRPAHLTVFQTRDLIEKLARARGWELQTMIVLGHLDVKRIS